MGKKALTSKQKELREALHESRLLTSAKLASVRAEDRTTKNLRKFTRKHIADEYSSFFVDDRMAWTFVLWYIRDRDAVSYCVRPTCSIIPVFV